MICLWGFAERAVPSNKKSVELVLKLYTLIAAEWDTGSHLLAVPRIDVSRHCIRLDPPCM